MKFYSLPPVAIGLWGVKFTRTVIGVFVSVFYIFLCCVCFLCDSVSSFLFFRVLYEFSLYFPRFSLFSYLFGSIIFYSIFRGSSSSSPHSVCFVLYLLGDVVIVFMLYYQQRAVPYDITRAIVLVLISWNFLLLMFWHSVFLVFLIPFPSFQGSDIVQCRPPLTEVPVLQLFSI